MRSVDPWKCFAPKPYRFHSRTFTVSTERSQEVRNKRTEGMYGYRDLGWESDEYLVSEIFALLNPKKLKNRYIWHERVSMKTNNILINRLNFNVSLKTCKHVPDSRNSMLYAMNYPLQLFVVLIKVSIALLTCQQNHSFKSTWCDTSKPLFCYTYIRGR